MGARTQPPDTAEGRDERLEFEMLISDLSSRFINLPSDQVDAEIEETQRRVCEVLDVDFSSLWQETAEAGQWTLTHYFSSEELRFPGVGMSGQEYFPWLRSELLSGRSVVVASLEELPDVAAIDRDNLRLFGAKSNLAVPLSVGGTSPIGALCFNGTRAEREWPDELVSRLQLVAQIFANALARRRADHDLRESEARLSLAADSAGIGLWLLDYETETFWVTERARSLFGFGEDEAITIARLRTSVHPDDWGIVSEVIKQGSSGSQTVQVEYRIRVDGEVRWMSSVGRPQPREEGHPARLMGVSIDVTERRKAQDALRASEVRLQAGAELAGLAYYEMDLTAGEVFIDDRLRDLCGIPPDREKGLDALEYWLERLHPDDRDRWLEERERLYDGRLKTLSIEYRYLHPSQGERWIQHVVRVDERDASGHVSRSYGVLRDVTEQKQAEDGLRDLSRRLINAHEEERSLLARELHDDVSQRLAVLAIQVGRDELSALGGPSTEIIEGVRQGLSRLSEDVHALAYQLHPSVLEELGLADALRAECERRGHSGGLEVSLELGSLPAVLHADAALCLFRVAQEALSNVARHAGTVVAAVTLRELDEGLLLAIRDEGVGFDSEAAAQKRSLGLGSMRERVHLLHGTLDVETAPGEGTTVVAWVPAGEGLR
jgi:PAS domain S-box-containing protein